jgi:hypothetical protein
MLDGGGGRLDGDAGDAGGGGRLGIGSAIHSERLCDTSQRTLTTACCKRWVLLHDCRVTKF